MDNKLRSPASVFVYGTLKCGQVREKCWPRRPVSVEPATVRGALYDLGPYPGLTDGNDRVSGEVWTFAPSHMPATLAALDEIEGYRGRNDDENRRVIVECQTTVGILTAWTYKYAVVSRLREDDRIRADGTGTCRWNGSNEQRESAPPTQH